MASFGWPAISLLVMMPICCKAFGKFYMGDYA